MIYISPDVVLKTMIKKTILMIGLTATFLLAGTNAFAQRMDNFGQTIQIRTNLSSFVDKPSWLLIIRDIEHNQVIPYLYDFTEESNYWLAFTYSKNYLITVSELSFSPSGRKIKNFCHLESMGAIQRGTSLQIDITGKLTPRAYTSNCQVLKYA